MQAMIRGAIETDITRLIEFLQTANLGIEGITAETVPYFLMMESDEGELKGVLGIEPLGEAGLLRSLVVTKDMGERDIFVLFEQMLLLAKEKEIRHLYLATNKKEAVHFFRLLGFVEADKEALPEKLVESKHIGHVLNVDNSIFLKFSF
ncbi:MAG: hypothetical protein Q8906_16445 [Bacillota bacterium]|nr:hypothetical protein [Bacillota bacterium]